MTGLGEAKAPEGGLGTRTLHFWVLLSETMCWILLSVNLGGPTAQAVFPLLPLWLLESQIDQQLVISLKSRLIPWGTDRKPLPQGTQVTSAVGSDDHWPRSKSVEVMSEWGPGTHVELASRALGSSEHA